MDPRDEGQLDLAAIRGLIAEAESRAVATAEKRIIGKVRQGGAYQKHVDKHRKGGIDTLQLIQLGAGVPSATAGQGTLYFDTTNNDLYVNKIGAATWQKISVTGGGVSIGDNLVYAGTAADLTAGRSLAADTAHTIPVTGADPSKVLTITAVAASTSIVGHAKFDTTNPAAIGTAAPGASAVIADRAHVHATGAGTPSTQAFGDAAAVGTGPAAAMTDHKHAMPSAAAGTRGIAYTMDGGGATLTTGVRPAFLIPYACTIAKWSITGDAAGTCTIDVTTSTDSATPSYSSIVGAGTKPAVAGPAVGAVSTTPASWTSTSISARTLMQFNLSAVATFKWLTITLEFTVA